MRMTLSSPNNSNERQSGSITGSIAGPDNRAASPSSSPRSSPKPSPHPQTKREHTRSEIHLTVNYNKEPSPVSTKQDLSPSQELTPPSYKASTPNVEATSPVEINRSESTGGSSGKERKDGRAKKKSWFNSFYPTYKSRSEDFKRIFKDVPDEERLVVDYACALQKEILVQGRLYVSQNYLCFYANIFGWETNLTLKWKEVSAITKEKTALVIPNAVLIYTRSDKYFFTSFVARDKTYLMLFRVWQNALMDQPMTPQEMWQWVHQCYGEELGLTSDDEDYKDYMALSAEEDKILGRLSVESCSEVSQQECGSHTDLVMEQLLVEEKLEECNNLTNEISKPRMNNEHIPTDFSDTTESDVERNKFDNIATCSSSHEGRQIMSEVFPVNVDHLFTLMFTSSKFYLDFHDSRKSTDVVQEPWTNNDADNTKTRIVTLTMSLNQTLGPKFSHVTEKQVMLPCSKPGHLYAIDIESVNAGIPYADSFYLNVHYCLQKVSESESSLSIYATVRYRKSVWGLVKGMIEKSCYQGLYEHFSAMTKALHAESEEAVYPTVKRKSRKHRRVHSLQRAGIEDIHSKLGASGRVKNTNGGIFSSDVATIIVFSVLILLVVLNLMLYYKLWSLEEVPSYTLLDLHILKDPPTSHDEWIKLLQQQETLHSVEIQKWQRILKTAISLLRQTEESLNELQRSINPSYSSKVMSSVLQSQGEPVNNNRDQDL